MTKHQWTLICQSSVIDKDTNNLSIYNIVEKIGIKKEDFNNEKKTNIYFPFQLVSMWYRENVEKEKKETMLMTFSNSMGKELAKNEISMVFEKNIRTMRTRINIEGIQLEKMGTYFFNVYIKEKSKFKKVGEAPLEISFDDVV